MGRPRRSDHHGAWHHLMNRGSDRQDIFSDDIDHRQYQSVIGDAVDRGLVEVHANCEMTNHFHLLGRSPVGEISAAMHRIQSEYARWYNERHGRTGPLFTSRFTAVTVDTEEQLLTVARYIHRNPLAMGSHRSLADYPWSSYPVYLGEADAPAWLTTDVLSELGQMDRVSLRAFVEDDLPSDEPVARKVWGRVTFEQLVAVVSCVTGIAPSDLLAGSRRTAPARQLLAMLAVELRVATTREIADALGLAGASSVRVIARRGRVGVADDPSFALVRDEVLALVRRGRAVPGTGATGVAG